MVMTTLDTLLAEDFSYEDAVHFMQIATNLGVFLSSTSEAAIPPVNDTPLSGGSSASWAAVPSPVPGPSITTPGDMHLTPPDAPAIQATPQFAPAPPATQALTCGLAGGTACTQPLFGTTLSLREHMQMHGHKHPKRSTVQCPWMGCQHRLRWGNMTRHIRSIHMGIRLQCWACGRLFTRAKALEGHFTSNKNKCSKEFEFGGPFY